MSLGNIALITGATGGLGAAMTRLLAREPEVEEIWAVAREEKKLARLRQEVGEKLIALPLDLRRRESLEILSARLKVDRPQVRYLVNSAGVAKFCAYDDLDVDQSLAMVELNISALVGLTVMVLPYMPRGSHVLNIASQAAFQPLPYQNIYSSTKAFVRNYTRALHVELKPRGITATAVCPGWMDTALIDIGSIGAKRATTRFVGMVKPEPVAEKALKDARRGRDISVYSFYVKLAHLVAKLLPQRAMMRLWLWQQKLE